jgi:hypothetical protein
MDMNDKIEDIILKSIDKLMNKYYRKPTFTYIPSNNNGCGPNSCPPSQDKKQEKVSPVLETKINDSVDLKTILKDPSPKSMGFSKDVKTKVI